jgi:hypothetical protein
MPGIDRRPADVLIAWRLCLLGMVATTAQERGTEPVNTSTPTVEEVLRFEDLPTGFVSGHRVVVRWSDGSEGELLRWYHDELVVSARDLIGKTRAAIRSQRF